jgi:hypothetical protein
MLQRLDVGESENPEDVRRAFDNEMGVTGWATPGRTKVFERTPEDEGAPLWWHGAEEASQSFLASFGIVLQDEAPVEGSPGG